MGKSFRTVERKRRKQNKTRTIFISFRVEKDHENDCYVIENQLKWNGKSKGAYHESQWNEKDADAMNDPKILWKYIFNLDGD